MLEIHTSNDLDDTIARAPDVPHLGEEWLEWLLDVYSFVHQGEREAAIDLVSEKIDESLRQAQFDRCDKILQSLDVQRLNTSVLVAVLSITLAAKNELKSRAALVDRIEARLSEIESQRMEGLLSGLR